MKTITTTDDGRGQVGIGTLIIFIALVLVAAVAAGVLVNTAGLLQAKAQDTGSDAQSQVSNQIDVVSATGEATDGTSGVEKVELVVKKSPGSDPIDLSQATVQYTSDTATATIEYSDAELTTSAVSGGSATVLDDNGDRISVVLDVNTIEGGDLATGEKATLEIVDQSGASTVYGVNVPDVLTGKSYVRV